ncbi:MAG: TylF/MycF/NovP-related O-methyltransferase [Kiritimatiellia bacterium]
MAEKKIAEDFLDILRAERRDILNRIRETKLSTLKEGYSHTQVIPHATYSPWLDDQKFMKVYSIIRAYTLVDIYRCYELFTLASQMKPIGGDIVEVGVWRGGTAALVASVLPERNVCLFDTFCGVVKADLGRDTLYKGGEHSDADEQTVRKLFDRLGLKCKIFKGIFPEDSRCGLPDQISMAHIDVDTYLSAKDSFRAIWSRMSVGGAVVFDDYGFFGCEGVTQAVNEIRAAAEDAFFIHNLNGHGLIFKYRAQKISCGCPAN